jgi:4-amino-4-deoxy-L-arabinose transferase-like glycosyltransferase
MAALFAMTLPAGILASSGAKNDYYMAMWLVAAVYFALRFAAAEGLTDGLLFGAALGLALLTKATAYLFAPPLVAAVLLGRRGGPRLRVGRGLGAALAVALLLNLPLYVRNYDLSGSVLGSDSAQGDGLFRWRNETFGWRETASNMLRHVSEQLGGRSEKWNRGVYDVVVALHQRLGMDINDPRTTWRWSVYAPPRNANHETNVPNRWHLMLLLVAAGVLAWRARRSPARALYVLGLVAGLVLFCAYLKWQPFQARLLLPLFVLGAPLMGMMGEFGGRKVWIQAAVCLFLLNNARPFLMENWIRPLKGPRSVLHTPRDVQYFADLTFWANRPTYEKTVELLAGWDCARIGIDATHLDLEYPLQALLRERKPGSEFLHTGVTNASARYRQPVEGAACAVVCLDCAGDSEMPRRYSGFPQRVAIDKFVIFGR